ncbi:MAG: endonuclease/exonuclease/phosphatase family protein [Acidobacteriota bacterium]|nr:endonuclease/exonuclease/phosphatase family protein [Acidobacteriota bacterium]
MNFRLASYNIHRAIGVDRRFRPERIVEILADHDADIVLLQEVDEGAPRSRELDLAKELALELGFEHYAVGHNVTLRKGRYGNATLSRFPILRERNIDLTIGIRKRRGCQHTTLALGAEETSPRLEIFNMHLGLSARERRQQVGLLASSPEFAQLSHRCPCIVGGDTNDWRSQLRPFFVEALDFICATDRQTRRGPRAIQTYPSFSPRGALDRLYYRGPLQHGSVYRCRHKIAQVASDHLPVIADFSFDDAPQREDGEASAGS